MIVGDMERKHNINLFLLSVLLLMTVSCSTTRNLPEDETLYVGVKNMEILNEDKTPAGVQTLEVPPPPTHRGARNRWTSP